MAETGISGTSTRSTDLSEASNSHSTAPSGSVKPRKRSPSLPRSRLMKSVGVWRLALLIFILGGWELSSGLLLDPLLISSPSAVAVELIDIFATGEIWPHIKATYSEVGVGYSMAAVGGVTLGILLGRSRFLAKIFEPFIMAAYSIPKIALAPLFILWLGIGANSKIGISFLSAIFLIFYATFTGTKNMNESLVTVGRLLGAKKFDLIRKVYVPMALPFILDGLRAGIPFAVIGAVVGEFMASNVGLGFYILRASSNLDATGTFAGIIVLVLGVSVLNFVLLSVERHSMKWKPQTDAENTA